VRAHSFKGCSFTIFIIICTGQESIA